MMQAIHRASEAILKEVYGAESLEDYLKTAIEAVPSSIDRNTFELSDLKECLSVLYALDRYATSAHVRDFVKRDGTMLNTTCHEEVEIYPTYFSMTRKGVSNDTLASCFENLIFFVKSKRYKGLKLRNFYLDSPTHGTVRIAYIPYPMSKKQFFGDSNDPSFMRTSLDEEDELFLKRCEKAFENYNADILFSAELCGSPALDTALRGFCLPHGSSLVICPSYHLLQGGNEYNRSTMFFLSGDLPKKADLYKAIPALFRDGRMERLCCPDVREFPLFHIPQFGKIGCLLCSDFLREDFRILISELNLDVVIVQCYTSKLTDFYEEARNLTADKQFIFIGNACHAMSAKKVPIAYTSYKYDHTKLEEAVILNRDDKTCDDCTNENCYWVYELTATDEAGYKQLNISSIYKGE